MAQPAYSTSPLASQRDAFVGRLLESARGVFDIFGVYLGIRLGLYDALAASGGGALSSSALACRTRTHERYVREWLEQQTVAGILEVDDESAPARVRRYRLPAARAEVLTDRDSLDYLAPLPLLLAGAVSPLPQVLDAYRSGGGVPYADYGPDLRDGQAGINRAPFLKQLGGEWLPQIPEVHARLQSTPPARIADVGCGAGWSSIGLAQSYPDVRVDGFDLDAPSIEQARENAAQFGLAERVRFHVCDARDAALDGGYDLVIACECVHDLSHPVEALRTMRRLAADAGSVLVVDERVGERFTAAGNDVEWMMYGWSILHCLPAGKADEGSAATGTVMRPDTLRGYAEEAGFRRFEALPIDSFFFRFYRLVP